MALAQRIVLIAGMLIVLGMALFPPWLIIYDPPGHASEFLKKSTRPAGYHLVFTPHVAEDQTALVRMFGLPPKAVGVSDLRYFSVVMDTNRLLVQFGGALAVILILALLLKPRS